MRSLGSVVALAAISIAATTALSATTASAATAAPVYLNAGGAGYTAANGTKYGADAFARGGSVSSSSPVSGTTDAGLYRTIRYGMSGYSVPVTNGTYDVTVKMIENYWGAPGKRVFDVAAEGQTKLSAFDIFAAAGGKNKAVDRKFTATVTDGKLDLAFSARVNNASVAGLAIVPQPVSTVPTPVPSQPVQPPTTTSPTPTATATTSATPRLGFRPPALTAPTTITVTSTNLNLKLDQTKDYILKLANGRISIGSGSLSVWGGRNVVLIGGEINAPGSGRPLSLKSQTGTLHVEGVRLSGSGLKEGVNLDQRAGGTVQLQNIRIDPIVGSYSGHHADLIQTWSGPKVLRIDRFEGTSNYQCGMIGPKQFGSLTSFSFDLRNIVTRGNCAWFVTSNNGITGKSTNVKNVGTKRHILEGAFTVENVATAPSPLLGNPGASYVSPGYAG